MNVFGLDIGGSGIKGAPVDTRTGKLVGERIRVPTPRAGRPDDVVATAVKVISRAGWDGPVGVGFPGVVKEGVVHTAANVDKAFIGFDLGERLRRELGSPVRIVNDADAAGLAEVRWGAGVGVEGVVLMLTLGTGIGSALVRDGRLVPNTELGHLELDGHDAERRASDAARKREDLSWEQWAERVQAYLRHVDGLLWPDLVVLGGGVSKKADRWLHRLDVRPELRTAELLNDAGIVGAALLASEAPLASEASPAAG